MRMDVVVVGDTEVGADGTALVAAAREAMRNAAKYAGVDEVSVYAEIRDASAQVFVRDRGTGFSPAEVGDGHRGITESIVGRMQRNGGSAEIRSAPGKGTEVELSIGRGEA